MHVVRAFVGVHGFEVHDVADDVILVRYAVGAMHIARDARDIERLAAIVPLDQGDHLRLGMALILEPADAEAGLQTDRDLDLHVGELLLDELVGGKRPGDIRDVEVRREKAQRTSE